MVLLPIFENAASSILFISMLVTFPLIIWVFVGDINPQSLIKIFLWFLSTYISSLLNFDVELTK